MPLQSVEQKGEKKGVKKKKIYFILASQPVSDLSKFL